MFDKVEFSDLYKFKTSIGLIMIVLGIIMPWFFLKQDSDLIISYDDYYNLIPESKSLFDKKLSLSSNVIDLIPYLSFLLILSGILLSIIGYKKWHLKQSIVDAIEQINYDNLKAGVKPQSEQEIKDKAKNDVEEEEDYESEEENSQTDYEKPNNNYEEKKEDQNNSELEEEQEEEEQEEPEKQDIKKTSKKRLANNVIDMENLFFSKIIDYNSFNYKVQSNVKIANTYHVDFLLNSYDTKKFSDLIIEIKYLQSKLTIHLVRDSFNKGMAIHSNYARLTSRNSRFILIIIYKENIARLEELNRFAEAINQFRTEIGSNHKIFLMSDKEALNFDIQEIVK